MLFSFILLAVIGIMLLNQLPHFIKIMMGGGHVAGRQIRTFQEVLIENNASENKIAVVDVAGLITSYPIGGSGNMVTLIADQLRAAGRDRNVRAVLLRVNSPGGEVMASDEIYRAIEEFQRETSKPVVASMSSLAASGGYYVSAPCRWIVANELTITGSIGVIMSGYNYRGLMDKIGLRPDVYKSGPLKNMMSGSRKEEEILPEEKTIMQGLIMETYGRFTNIVAKGRSDASKLNKGRGKDLSSDWVNHVDGRVFSGKQAFELGFVDELGNFETAVKRAQSLANIQDANLIQYQEPFDLGNLFRLFGKTETPTLKVDLGVDFPRLQPGYLYFLIPTVLR